MGRFGMMLITSILAVSTVQCVTSEGPAAEVVPPTVAPDIGLETGGPLAGLKLPPAPTQHGEPAGHPGCLPDRVDPFKTDDEGHIPYTPQGQAPELELYDGSVEHWRAYGMKDCPVRSLFDRQSQIANWTAPMIGGAETMQVETYAEPLYYTGRKGPAVDTNLDSKSVPVVRCSVGLPTLELDLGELDAGVYVIRVIGAVESESIRAFRQPLYLAARINDGPGGDESNYRIRLGYCDQFYSVAEVYFHATARRRYRAQLWVAAGSDVDLLVRSISLDDVLAGTDRRPIKTRATLATGEPPAAPKPLDAAGRPARYRRDSALWRGFPPVNAQPGVFGDAKDGRDSTQRIRLGSHDKTAEQICEQFGRWAAPGELTGPAAQGVFLVNDKLKTRYTIADLRQGKPLGDPYPFKDTGAGLYFPQAADTGTVWCPIAREVARRIGAYPRLIHEGADQYRRTGDLQAARNAAVALVRYAYAYPTLDMANALDAVVSDPSPLGYDARCRRRTTEPVLGHDPQTILSDYDKLFDYILGDQELADSLSRYVPWIQTPADVIELIDVYLVQMTAKRILRYHYHTAPEAIANLAAVVGDADFTRPWMQWLFARTCVRPLPVAGIQDAMISGCGRNGCAYGGSTLRCLDENAMRLAVSLQRYMATGGDEQFDLSNGQAYPKPIAHAYWRIQNVVAGGDFLRIGDDCGPDKAPGRTLADLEFARYGWNWTGDPKFAFILQHYLGSRKLNVAEAAVGLIRAPWLDNRSRSLPMWAGILETGLAHDDPRFRRAAYVRTGLGRGYHHNDAMDLQIVAGGQPVTIDGGRATDGASRFHNVVEVNDRNLAGYCWVQTLADAPGGRYLAAQGAGTGQGRLMRRQVALIDVDEGSGSQPIPISLQRPHSKLPADVTPANSYVFDVVRVSGGHCHTYCFHGPVDDQFQWNVADAAEVADPESQAAKVLQPFGPPDDQNQKLAGAAGAQLAATWRQTRAGDGSAPGSEQFMLADNYDADAPRRFLGLRLFGAEGAQALRARSTAAPGGYDFTCLMARRQGPADQPAESAFAAVIEPYVGQPLIAECRPLDISLNEADALRAVALEVQTTTGRTDVCFADGRPDMTRQIPGARLSVAGEYAYLSRDGDGFRQAVLVGGTYLQSAGVRILLPRRQCTARVVAADYANKTITLNERWPVGGPLGVIEIGRGDHWTSFTAVDSATDGEGTRLTLDAGADAFRSAVTHIDSADGIVTCAMGLALGKHAGLDRNWVASNDDGTIFWRAEYLGDRSFKLTGPPVDRAAIGAAGVLRLWNCGVEDLVHQRTFAAVRRLEAGLYELTGSGDVTISLPGQVADISADKRTWATDVGTADGNLIGVKVSADDLIAHERIYLRIR